MSKLTKKIVSIATTVTVAVMLIGPAGSAQALTAAELQAQIAALQAQLAALTAQLADLDDGGDTTPAPSGDVPAACSGITFTRNLAVGSTGADVKCLQALLNTDSATVVAVSGVGSAGSETTYFGNLTKAAVVKFQNKYQEETLAPWGLTQGTGFFGSTSREKANALLAAGTGTGDDTTGDDTTGDDTTGDDTTGDDDAPVASGLSVALSSATPAARVLPDDSQYNEVLTLDFTANGGTAVITGLDLTRGGFIANTNITGVSVWDGENRLGNITTALTTDNTAIVDFGSEDIVIASGQTKSLMVKINLGNTTGTVNFSLASAGDVNVEGSTSVTGSFPMAGALMTISDSASSLGNVYVQAQTVGALTSSNAQTAGNGNISVGDTGVEVAKFKFTQNNSLEAIQIEQLVVYLEGTITEMKDMTNWALYDSFGALLAESEGANDRYMTFDFDDPYVISKGTAKTLTLKGDVADGSTHYFRAQIQNDYDMMVKGVSTGAYLKPLNSAGSAWVAGTSGADANSFYRIKVGSLTVTKSADSPTGTVSPGDTDIVLAKYNLKAGGEDLEIRQMGLYIEAATTASARILTGSVKVQNAETGVTYLSVAASDSGLQGAAAGTYALLDTQNLSTYINIPSGDTVVLNVIGTIQSNDTIETSDNYQANVGKFYSKRLASNDFATLPGTGSSNYYEANQLDVAALTLTINKNNAFSGQRTAKGVSEIKIGEFVLAASTADDIRVSTIKVSVSTTTGVQNVRLKRENGTQVGSTVGTPTATGDTFTVSYTIPKATSELLQVYADITTDNYATTILASVNASGVSGSGVNSSKSLASATPSSSVVSNGITVGTAALAIRRSASAPTSQILVAGQTGVTLNEIEFEASYEDLSLQAITFDLTSASTSLWASGTEFAQNFSKVYLYDGSTLLNTGGTSVASGQVAITGIDVTLPADTVKTLTVKADITGSGTLAPKSVGAIQQNATSTTAMSVYSSTGLMSSGVTITTHAASNNFLFTDSAISIAAASGWTGSKTGSMGPTETVAKYVITNTGTRTITLTELRLVTILAGAGNRADYVQTIDLYDENDVKVCTSTLNVASTFVGVTTTLAGATTTYAKFNVERFLKDSAASNASSTLEIAAGASKTYTVKANTLNVEAGESTPGQVNVSLTTYIAGSKGYNVSDTAQSDALTDAEYYWNDGDVFYEYTPAGGSEYRGLRGTDTVNVYGPTLTY